MLWLSGGRNSKGRSRMTEAERLGKGVGIRLTRKERAPVLALYEASAGKDSPIRRSERQHRGKEDRECECQRREYQYW